jgi:Cft2 family RNA processing exonuclease/dsRNA-specific ribonuclease
MSDRPSMEVSFLGGATTIGASCSLVRVGNTAVVVDCGVRYSGGSPLPDLAPLAETAIDAVLLTHAHMDHSGGLPVLMEACPAAPVLATPPTIDLISILLNDALRLMNSPEREADLPLYSERQVERLLASCVSVKYHQTIRVKDIEVRWLPAGHILGAAMLQLKTPAGTILFTGDYSVSAQQTVPAVSRPDFQADLVISESTYGERLHEDRNAAEERLLSQIREVVTQGGRVLIPAFAVGRAQEVLLILKRAQRKCTLPEVPVFVDGMVRAVCSVYGKHESYVSRQLLHEIRREPQPFYSDTIQPVAGPEDRKRVLATSPCIIVSSSGMLAGGPSLAYAQALAPNPQDAIFLTGYQDEESPGRALLELARTEGPKELRLGQATFPVACRFGTYGLSAHADRMQMVSLIEASHPRTVALVHGDESAKEALGRSLRCGDVIAARDGFVLRRDYPPRSASRGKPSLAVPAGGELDIDRARHLLGPAGEAPVRADAVAEAWFGQLVDRSTAEGFARVLEAVGLVRRDDDRRDRLWVLGPHETHLFPDEAAQEEQLKRANPKGRLLEFCARMRIGPPETETEPEGAFFRANMSLSYQGETVASGPQRAASKKAAEQLAAQALLELVTERVIVAGVIPVNEEDLARLQSTNPKGRLLELCAKRKCPPPQFEQHANPGGYQVRAVLPQSGEQQSCSAWYLAATLKAVEQAAAEELLKSLPDLPASPQAAVASIEPEPKGIGAEAAMVLNELKQVGVLKSFGYDVVDQLGPSHQPVFSVIAWSTTTDGQTWRAAPVQASSKKSAQRAAAAALLDLLVQHGITRQ